MIYAGTIDIPNAIKRKHFYEGYTETDIANDIKKEIEFSEFHGTKPDRLIIVSAVGGLNESFKVGDIVVIRDLITLTYKSTYRGASFVDMSQPIDKRLSKAVFDKFPSVRNGIHAFMRGPHYETFEDKMVLKKLGADVVGMSTTPEVIVANRLGIPCIALGLVTNLAFVKHSHEEVKKEVEKAMPRVKEMVEYLENYELE